MRRFGRKLVAVEWVRHTCEPFFTGPMPAATYRVGSELPPARQRDGLRFARRRGYRPAGMDRR